jgi:hypothetical protein
MIVRGKDMFVDFESGYRVWFAPSCEFTFLYIRKLPDERVAFVYDTEEEALAKFNFIVDRYIKGIYRGDILNLETLEVEKKNDN